MGRYLVKRILLALISLWALVSICFFLLRFLPGGPFSEDEALHPLIRSHFEKIFGLNDSLPVQYGSYWKALLQGDLGRSYQNPAMSVLEILQTPLQRSLSLGLVCLIFIVCGALLFAFFFSAKSKRLEWGQNFALLAFAVPGLVLAPLLVDLFALRLGVLPVARAETWLGYVLPVIAISLRPICRLGQTLALEIDRLKHNDASRTMLSLGFSARQLTLRWILPEALVAVLAQLGSLIANVLAGSFFVEVVFAIPGLGSVFAEALTARDYPVVLGVSLWIGTLVFSMQLLVDVGLAYLDPRIRPEESQS